MDKSFVKNAADPKQVKEASRKVKNQDDQFELDLQAMLATKSGRNVLWRVMEFCKSFHSPLSGESEINGILATYMNIGGQNVGRYIMAEIERVDEQALLEMMRDNKQSK